jgi:hypothetical protein
MKKDLKPRITIDLKPFEYINCDYERFENLIRYFCYQNFKHLDDEYNLPNIDIVVDCGNIKLLYGRFHCSDNHVIIELNIKDIESETRIKGKYKSRLFYVFLREFYDLLFLLEFYLEYDYGMSFYKFISTKADDMYPSYRRGVADWLALMNLGFFEDLYENGDLSLPDSLED